ncbi:hypothetical protein F2Q69_00035202 [Brassica cretica]|uniref:Uncharacterized protein n=1 Tax=Brassica cretica TaxID=69181 RepID=A0A8S9SRE9_BRACR|nr:hypothetical protein F2Q69_00035202 [Brassica cretica]
MPDNLYTTYKLDRKGLTGKHVLRISTPGRTTKGLIPSTRRSPNLIAFHSQKNENPTYERPY